MKRIKFLICMAVTIVLVMSSCTKRPSNDTPNVPNNPIPPTINQLIDDPLAEVDFVNSHIPRVSQDENYQKILASSQPLEIGECYIEDFTKPVNEQRLRPYTRFYEVPDIVQGAQFEILSDGTKRSVLVTTDGEQNGAFDYIEFAGMRFSEDALYSVKITYTVRSSRAFLLGFGHDYFLNLEGIIGETYVGAGTFFVTSDGVGYNGNQITTLLLMVNGGVTGAQIEIKSIEIERLQNRPSLKNLKLSGNYYSGSTLTLSYDFIGAKEESGTKIEWFLASNKDGRNMTVMTAYNDQKQITLTNAMNGHYIGARVTPKMDSDSLSAVGKTETVYGMIKGSLTSYPSYSFNSVGKSLVEDFESISVSGNIGFAPENNSEAYITDGENVINGNRSLYVSVSKGISGFYFEDLIFGAAGRYKISFKMKLLLKSNEIAIQFRQLAALGYAGDIKMTIPIANAEIGETFEVVLPSVTIPDVSGYCLQMFSNGASEFLLDDFKIERVEDNASSLLNGLKNVGGEILEDFDSGDVLGIINFFEWSGIYVTLNGIEQNSLIFESTRTNSFSITAYFETLNGYLHKGGTYRLNFDYKVITAVMPTNFYVGFRTQAGNQVNQKVDFEGKFQEIVYSFTHDFVLENADGYFMQMFNLDGNDGSKILIDNIKIKRIV